MKDEAERNSLNDLIASGGLPEATPTGEKTREQLIADKDAMRAEIAKLKKKINGLHESLDAHDEMIKQLKAERDAAYVRGLVRGLERAQEIAYTIWHERDYFDDLIQAEIQRMGKP